MFKRIYIEIEQLKEYCKDNNLEYIEPEISYIAEQNNFNLSYVDTLGEVPENFRRLNIIWINPVSNIYNIMMLCTQKSIKYYYVNIFNAPQDSVCKNLIEAYNLYVKDF